MKNPINLLKYLPHLLRKKFKEKYIIIESDDWGLERGLNLESISWIRKKYGQERMSRWSLDSLESVEDLNMLYELLAKYKNKFESPPIITANFITHNIDYSSQDDLKFIPIVEGYKDRGMEINKLYDEGISKKFIFPQLHGYSHYNLSEAKNYFITDEGKESFAQKFFFAKSTIKGNLKFLQGELSLANMDQIKIKEAAQTFKKVFNFSSVSIIPPTFIFDKEFINILKTNNISLVQSSNRLQTSGKKRLSFPFFQKRKGLYWSIRNARLDPHKDYGFYHDQCISSIETAFKYKMPAVIDFHRVNFAGTYTPEYREKTIKELDLLLDKVHKKWPEAKFIHTQKLNDILWQQQTR